MESIPGAVQPFEYPLGNYPEPIDPYTRPYGDNPLDMPPWCVGKSEWDFWRRIDSSPFNPNLPPDLEERVQRLGLRDRPQPLMYSDSYQRTGFSERTDTIYPQFSMNPLVENGSGQYERQYPNMTYY